MRKGDRANKSGVAVRLRTFGVRAKGIFFPVTQLPAWIRPIAYLTPIWHGVALCRELCLGIATVPSAFLHVGYLLVVLGAGIIAGNRTYTRRLYV